MNQQHVLVIGAGIFGVTAALELRARGYRVSLIDPGPIPHPLAASTDISKVVRIEYGPDEFYMSHMETARGGWLAWNKRWRDEGRDPLYHETGVVMVCRQPMAPDGFEYESWKLLEKRGHRPVRLGSDAIAKRFPAWHSTRYVDGFFHAKGGFAESARVVSSLIEWAVRDGVELHEGRRITALIETNGRVTGVRDHHNRMIKSDHVVLAAGAWIAKLLSGLDESIAPSGHPVFHLQPKKPELFEAERFPTFTADVSQTGYYGFPVNRDGVLKIANHGVGSRIDPDAPREVSSDDRKRLIVFLQETFPDLVDAEVIYTRLCLYADTQDEDFWIAQDPERKGLTVSGGGSGHGFKFAPVLGAFAADAVEGLDNPALERFRWRAELRLGRGREAARCHDDDPKAR